jgi:hypothetical protein
LHSLYAELKRSTDRHQFIRTIEKTGYGLDETTAMGEIHKGKLGMLILYVRGSYSDSRIFTLTYSPKGVSEMFCLVEDGLLRDLPDRLRQ